MSSDLTLSTMSGHKFPTVFLLPCIATAAIARASVPEFSGYLVVGKQRLFVLTTVPTHESSGWLAIGGTFKGFTIEAFDLKHELLLVRTGAQTVKLPLKSTQVLPSATKTRPQTTSSHVEGGLELKLSLSSDGLLSLNGHPLPGETFDALFTVMARENDALRLIIEREYTKRTDSDYTAFLKALTARMQAAGIKRGAIQVTQRRDEAQEE